LHQFQEFMEPSANFGLCGTLPARLDTKPERDVHERRHVTEEGIVLKHEADLAFADMLCRRVLTIE
jgi:hypothetical protein